VRRSEGRGCLELRDSGQRPCAEQERGRNPISLILFKAIGVFFAIEGGANIVYWRLFGKGVKDNDYWQIGRLMRTFLGIVLLILG
jgi:hypothetical protein